MRALRRLRPFRCQQTWARHCAGEGHVATPRPNISQALVERSGLQVRQLEQLRIRFERLAGAKGYLSQEDFDAWDHRSEKGLLDILMGFHNFASLDRNRFGRVYFEDFVLGVASAQEASRDGARIPHSIRRRGRGRVMLKWREAPRTVLIIAKSRDHFARAAAAMVGKWLQFRGMRVFVEQEVHEELSEFELGVDAEGVTRPIDFMVCLGGDGTLLHACSLFDREEVVPPCLSFGLGSLGFLTPFKIEDYKVTLAKVIAAHTGEGVAVSLRSRLRCEVRPGASDAEGASSVHVVLNECFVGRGSSLHLCKLGLIVDGEYITTVQGDGLIVSTPSGSTAYSLSVGGSMVAPSVHGILLTPIAPHSLSFRPVIVDGSATIEVVVLEKSRGKTARVTLDGRNVMEVGRGGSVRIETSMCPVPLVNMQPFDTEWFHSIRAKLHWNVRTEQKAFDMEEK